MISEEINVCDYIYQDKEEIRIKEKVSNEEYKENLKINRGIKNADDSKRQYVDCNEFVNYILKSKRIHIFNLDKGERYLRNKNKKCYEKVSEDTFSKVLLFILGEYDETLYTESTERKIIHICDLKTKTFHKLPKMERYIVFPNGTYDLQKKEFIDKFSKEILNTFVMEYEYEENADCPRFRKFLNDVFNSDTETIKCIQEFFGYTLALGKAPADKILFLYSRGRSGKSVIINVLTKVLGVENVSSISLHKLNARFSLGSICDKFVNICPESSEEKLSDTGILKSISGRDKVMIERKYENPYDDYVFTKIIIVSNNYLRFDDDSHGMWERVIAIPFPNIYVPLKDGEEIQEDKHYQNPNLENELMTELPGIFNYFIEGLKRLEQNNWKFTESSNCQKMLQQLLLVNKPIKYFAERYVLGDKESKIGTSQLHTYFKQWCDINSIDIGKYSQPQKFHEEFRNVLLSLGIDYKIKKISKDYYAGISVDVENIMEKI